MTDRPDPATRRVALAILLPALAASAAHAGERTVTIRGNGTPLGPTPLIAPVTVSQPPGDYLLHPDDGGPALRANVFEAEDGPRIALQLDTLGAEGVRTFRLRPAPADVRGGIGVSAEDDRVVVRVGGEPFTALRRGEFKPYLYPVIGPTGEPFTRAYPMEDVPGEDRDHPHQRSFWFTHGDVNGYDFWASDPGNPPNPRFGTIREAELLEARGGLAVGRLRTRNSWLAPDGRTIGEDTRTLAFAASEGVRFIDVDITLTATDGPLTFGDTKEGTFGLRVASSLDVKRGQGGRIVNAEGLADGDAWGKPSPWVDYTGPVAGRTVGLAILDHPESFRHPTTWHVRDYGLFAANPFGYHDFGINKPGSHTLPAGRSLRFRYRVILHEGRTEEAGIASAFRAFAQPPSVEFGPES